MRISIKLGVEKASSTEKELVANGERFLNYAWFQYSRLSQGDNAKEDDLAQESERYILSHKPHPFSI